MGGRTRGGRRRPGRGMAGAPGVARRTGVPAVHALPAVGGIHRRSVLPLLGRPGQLLVAALRPGIPAFGHRRPGPRARTGALDRLQRHASHRCRSDPHPLHALGVQSRAASGHGALHGTLQPRRGDAGGEPVRRAAARPAGVLLAQPGRPRHGAARRRGRRLVRPGAIPGEPARRPAVHDDPYQPRRGVVFGGRPAGGASSRQPT